MYRRILIPVDNSDYSNFGIGIGIALAKKFNSRLVGAHVYAAALHDNRFGQMEGDLPPKYQGKVEKQRKIHDSLITKGLEIISDSYLDVFEERCHKANVGFERRLMEGKNFEELVKDVNNNGYGLVIVGILGLGAVKNSLIGSVCERVVRRIRTDVLVVKNEASLKGKILVGIDGSPQSFAGLKVALTLGKAFNGDVEAVSVFDPHFHTKAFKSIKGVLSEEAGKVFRFKEQERLHDEIIDKGLEKIYQRHLDLASKIALEEGVEIRTTLLAGKPFDQILEYVKKEKPSLLVLGRVGIHCVDGLDIGCNTENLLRLSPCNILIAGQEFMPSEEDVLDQGEEEIPWQEEAKKKLERIPSMVREIARRAIEGHAREKGYKEITPEVMDEARERLGL